MTPSDIDTSYAWARLAAALAMGAIGGVGMWSVAVVLPAVQAEFGIDRGTASLPYSMTMLGLAIGGIMMGRLLDRRGIRAVLLIGALGVSFGYAAAAMAGSLWQFVLAQGVLIGMLGSSAMFAPLVTDISMWFERRRGLAVGLCACGNYLAGAIWPPLLQWGVANYGWRQTYLATAAITFATMLPLIFAFRRPPPEQPVVSAAAEASKSGIHGMTPATVQGLLCLAGIACCVAMSMPQVHIVAYCGDLGYGVKAGAEMLSLMLAAGIVSRLLSGWICDHIGGVPTLLLGSILQGLALIAYLPFDGLVGLYIVSATFGLAQGGIVPSYAIVVRELFPAASAGARVSAVLMSTVAGMAIGGWISGVIYDATGTYRMAFLHGVAWNVLNIAIALFLFNRMTRGRQQAVAA